MADLDARQLQQLAETLGKVMSQQGQYMEDEREKRSASQRAADMRKADNHDKQLYGVMRRLGEQLGKRDKSIDNLTEMVKATKDANQKLMEAYDKNFERAQKAMVDALKDSIKESKELNDALKNLAGNITDMKDVLNFQDIAEQLSEVGGRIENARDHASSTAKWFKDLTELSETLRHQGKTFEGIDGSLKEFDDLIEKYTHIVEVDGRKERQVRPGMGDDESIGKQIQAMLKNQQISQTAQNNLQKLSQQAVTASANTAAKALNNHASLWNATTQRVSGFGKQVFTAANALVMLEKAAKLLYEQTKTSYSTGTNKNIFDVGRQDMSSFLMGVDPNVIQQGQVHAARNRASEGRVDWDNRYFDSINELSKVTGDRNAAAKANAKLVQSMNRLNLSNEAQFKNLHGLNDSYLKLQYLTGMTAEQFADLNESILQDADFRRQMLGLSEKEKSAVLQNINSRLLENEQIGISVDQTKEQIALMKRLYDPLDPKKRFKNQYKEQLFLQTQGVGGADAKDIATMNRVGDAKYQAQLAEKIGEEAAAQRVKQLRDVRGTVAERTQAKLADDNNIGLGMVTQGLVDKTGMSPYTSDAFLKSKGLDDKGQAQFNESVGNFDKAVNNFTSKLLTIGDYLGNFTKTATGLVIGAVGIMAAASVATRLLGGLGALSKLANLTKIGSIGGAVNSVKNIFTGGAAVAAGGTAAAQAAGAAATGAAAPAAAAAGGAAAGTAAAGAGVAGAATAAKSVGTLGKIAKFGKASLPGLALAGTAALAGDESSIGKVLNSNTVNGAMLGATVGSFVPVLGTGIGAGIGGAIGGAMDLWDYASSPSTPKPLEATSPTKERPATSPVNSRADSKPVEAPMKDQQGVDPNATVVALLKQQNDTLTKLLRAVLDQTNAQLDNSDKYMSAQQKLQRAIGRIGANGDSDLAASAKYN